MVPCQGCGGYEIRKWARAKEVALVNLTRRPLTRYHDWIRAEISISSIRCFWTMSRRSATSASRTGTGDNPR